MNIVDLTVVFIIVASMLIGGWRGFIREFMSLASWVVALWVAYSYAHFGAEYLTPHIEQEQVRLVAAYAAIFVVVLLAVLILGHMFEKLLTYGGIDRLDRSLGVIFGIARGIIVVVVLIFAVAFLEWNKQPLWQESILIEYLTPVAEMLRALISSDLTASAGVEDLSI